VADPGPAPPLRDQLDAATARLGEAGVPSPRVDAELLAAHVLALSRSEVTRQALVGGPAPTGEFTERYDALVHERARRVPLQHLTGRAPFRDLELAVGPGVFVPRPETEDVAGAAIEAAREVLGRTGSACVVDLCAGSAAIALAVVTEVPGTRVLAVEVSAAARAWAAANIAGLAPGRVDLRPGDVTEPEDPDLAALVTELGGTVDVVVSNPPYVPPGHQPVDPEVRDHDPEVALYGGGPDGLAVPRHVIGLAERLLRPGGLLVMEHADVQGERVVAALTAPPSEPAWQQVEDHADLAGRPRYVTAVRRPG
jgi:release factor glutamine methyltransferase